MSWLKGLNISIKQRNLPHWHCDGCMQFVTFHLADSLPSAVRESIRCAMEDFKRTHPEPWSDETRRQYNAQFATKTNEYLDAGYGSCCLRVDACAKIMEDALLQWDEERYLLHHYVVMPNHVHVLLELADGEELPRICQRWKGSTAREINKVMGGSGQMWHHESWDRMLRNELHYDRVIDYINQNIAQGGVRWKKDRKL